MNLPVTLQLNYYQLLDGMDLNVFDMIVTTQFTYNFISIEPGYLISFI